MRAIPKAKSLGATKTRMDAVRDTGGDAASCFTALLETSNFVTAEATSWFQGLSLAVTRRSRCGSVRGWPVVS